MALFPASSLAHILSFVISLPTCHFFWMVFERVPIIAYCYVCKYLSVYMYIKEDEDF